MTESPFAKIFFKREGGGNKAFFVTTDSAADTVLFKVVKYDFKETEYTFTRPLQEEKHVKRLLTNVLSGNAPRDAESGARQLPTGTWVHIYGVTPSETFVEITDRKLIDGLMVLEEMVEKQHREG
ncbi:MAG: hypothetical protein WB699_14630 [Bacteroidota bacterium]